MKHRPDLVIYDHASVLYDIQRNVCSVTIDVNYLYSYGDHTPDNANDLLAGQPLPLLP